MPRIYLDANATTPMLPEVREAMRRVAAEAWANASSVHEEGRRARQVLEEARREIAETLGARSQEILLCSGATEANNAAVCSAAFEGRRRGCRHLVVSAVEHPSVLGPVERLVHEEGFTCTLVQPDARGRIRAEQVLDALREDTALVAWMAANNEIGNLYPVAEAAPALAERGVHLHVDCVQLLGRLPIDLHALGAATAAISAHKAHGPKGVGALYLRDRVRLRPLVVGGHQERERRAGTEAVASIAGFAAAAAVAQAEVLDSAAAMLALRERLWSGIQARIRGVKLNGDPNPERRLPNTLNLSFDGTEGETVLISLDLLGFAVSSGSACTAGSLEPSHVLLAMGLDPARARAAVRFSLSRLSTAAEIDALVEALPEVVAQVRDAAPEAANHG